MMQVPLFDPTQFNAKGPSRGRSLWDAKRLALTNEIKAQKWNADWWGRGIAPSVALIGKGNHGVGDDPVSEELFLSKLKAKLAGKNGEPMLLLGDWLVQQLEASQRDAQFVEGQDQNRKAILAGNTPPIAMGDNEANYANANAQIKAWLSFDVIPALTFLASSIDTTFVYDEPRTWTRFSTEDIEELQEGKAARVDRYVNLINARHSPKVAAQIAGIDVDPTMPGFDEVFVPFSQMPYADAIAKDEPGSAPVPVTTAPVTAPPSSTPPAEDQPPANAEPTAPKPATTPQPSRVLRVRVPNSNVITRAAESGEILRMLLQIVEKDTKKLKDRARQFQVQAFEAGADQIGKALELEALLSIDNPRVVDFLEQRGNLIESVPQGVAERIFNKTVSLVEKGTSPEDIGTILRKGFNELTSAKAAMISRNEVGSALNGGRFLQMEEEGVDAREWLSSRDARVRDSHNAVDGEIVQRTEKYSNGLRFPQDPDGAPEETIQCRCIELPAERGKRSARCAAHMRAIAALELRFATERGEQIDTRTAYWRAVVQAKNIRVIERRMADAMGAVIHGWRAPILKALSEMGVAA
jgi:SPP1 gp7 family putative phage head morphogenesis protein